MNNERTVAVYQATLDEIDNIVPLFDAYRQFYGNPSDPENCRAFLVDRYRYNQSILFLAIDRKGAAVGFAQLYPSFSSGSLAQVLLLNDLFVVPSARRQGVGSEIIHAAANYGRAVGAVRLSLATRVNNKEAQALYEGKGWNRDSEFCVYHLLLRQ